VVTFSKIYKSQRISLSKMDKNKSPFRPFAPISVAHYNKTSKFKKFLIGTAVLATLTLAGSYLVNVVKHSGSSSVTDKDTYEKPNLIWGHSTYVKNLRSDSVNGSVEVSKNTVLALSFDNELFSHQYMHVVDGGKGYKQDGLADILDITKEGPFCSIDLHLNRGQHYNSYQKEFKEADAFLKEETKRFGN
jgi:hypothetical protein